MCAFLCARWGGSKIYTPVCLPMAMMMMSRRARQILSGRSNCSHGLMDYLVPGVYFIWPPLRLKFYYMHRAPCETERKRRRVLGCCGTSLNCLGKQTSPDRARRNSLMKTLNIDSHKAVSTRQHSIIRLLSKHITISERKQSNQFSLFVCAGHFCGCLDWLSVR
jgi:hypothetical protein